MTTGTRVVVRAILEQQVRVERNQRRRRREGLDSALVKVVVTAQADVAATLQTDVVHSWNLEMPLVGQLDLELVVFETEIIVVVDGAARQNGHERLSLHGAAHQAFAALTGTTFIRHDQRPLLLDPLEEGVDANQVEVRSGHDGQHAMTSVEGGELTINWQNALHDAGLVRDVEQASRLEGRICLGCGAVAGTEHGEKLEEHGGFQGSGCAREWVVSSLVGDQVVEAGVVRTETDAFTPFGETVKHWEALVARRDLDQPVGIDGQVGDGVGTDELVAPDLVLTVQRAVLALITEKSVETEKVKDFEVHCMCLVWGDTQLDARMALSWDWKNMPEIIDNVNQRTIMLLANKRKKDYIYRVHMRSDSSVG